MGQPLCNMNSIEINYGYEYPISYYKIQFAKLLIRNVLSQFIFRLIR